VHRDSFTSSWVPLLHRTLNNGGYDTKDVRRRLESRKGIRTKISVASTNTFRETPNLMIEYLLTRRTYARTHCATSRKVAGLIPDEVIGIFQLP
jgi:hypothetical protein